MKRKLLRGLAYAVDTVFPTRILAALCSLGFGIDLTLQITNASGILAEGSPLAQFTIAMMAWLWITIAWAIYGLARAADWIQQRGGLLAARLFRVAVGCTLAMIVAISIGSWGLNTQIGRFATLDTLLFLVANPLLSTWDHMGPGERRSIVLASLAAPAVIWAFCWLLRHTPSLSRDRSPRDLRASWILAGIVLVGIWTPIASDLSAHRSATRIESVRSRLHPLVTLASSSYDLLAHEPIQASIDPKSLVAREASWTVPENSARPSVIFLAIESLRSDVVGLRHQGKLVAPNLTRLAAEGLTWNRAYAQSTHSDYADVCIVSSLYPLRTQRHHYYRSDDPWPKTLAFDLFKQAGYATAIMSSQNESWGGMDQFLQVPSLDLFFDSARSNLETYTSARDPGFALERAVGAFHAGSLYDNQTMDRTLQWIDDQLASQTPYFISMNLQTSHFPYELPPGTEEPFQPARMDRDVTFMYHPPEKTPLVRNAYYNAIHNCDKELGRLVEHLQEQGVLNDTILVVLGENGEAFHENGSVGHAREPVEPALHVATVIHAPNLIAPATDDYPLEHIDVLPTVMGLLDWPAHPNLQGSDLLSDQRTPLSQRLIFHHVNSGAALGDAVQWAGRWKLVIDRQRHSVQLFDLENDPQESTDVAGEHPVIAAVLHDVLTRWYDQQLAYYRFPAYYQNFYPPQPPTLSDQQLQKLNDAG
ncbi:Arylsulfatase [Rosistilla oblonga]|nr:Arylsulfatase [Rosistilla oblonga]